MNTDPGAISLPPPLAFFLTWTTYGTWLPGDERGWVTPSGAPSTAAPWMRRFSQRHLAGEPVVLALAERGIVEQTIRDHCRLREWTLHAVSCRTRHVHVVVDCDSHEPRKIVAQFKGWCSRHLDASGTRGRAPRWWTKGGSTRYVFDMQGLVNVVTYVRECQDRPREETGRAVAPRRS